MDDELLEKGLDLAEKNNIEVRIDDGRAYAIIELDGVRRAAQYPINAEDDNAGHAVYKAVAKAIEYIKEHYGLAI